MKFSQYDKLMGVTYRMARSRAFNCLRKPLWSTLEEKQAQIGPDELVSDYAHQASLDDGLAAW
jgi:hypothetical protein